MRQFRVHQALLRWRVATRDRKVLMRALRRLVRRGDTAVKDLALQRWKQWVQRRAVGQDSFRRGVAHYRVSSLHRGLLHLQQHATASRWLRESCAAADARFIVTLKRRVFVDLSTITRRRQQVRIVPDVAPMRLSTKRVVQRGDYLCIAG